MEKDKQIIEDGNAGQKEKHGYPDILDGRAAYEKYQKVKADGLLLFEAVVGSQSYGTNTPESDTDIKFIYIDPLENVLDGSLTKQINVTDDYVGYEIGRYLQLLSTQNPNIIELVNADEKHIRYCHPLFRKIIMENSDKLLDRRVAFSFGEYARAQIKKAQGTNKKFMNPMDKERQTLLDFCWVGSGQGSIPLQTYMDMNFGLTRPWVWGAVAIDHMKNCYHLFFDKETRDKLRELDNSEEYDEMLYDNLYAHRKYDGVISKDGVNIKLSSIEKGVLPVSTFYCNIEGFQKYCKDYKEYWEWIEKRNEQRFVENASNEHNFDRKNLMHCIRLLRMCTEILEGKGVQVYREDREYLLNIRLGKRTYQDLVDEAEALYAKVSELYKSSPLPVKVDREVGRGMLLDLRKAFYGL